MQEISLNAEQHALTCLWVGDDRSDEFLAAVRLLGQHAQVTYAATVAEAAIKLAQRQQSPELIFLAQNWPGQFLASEVERLQRGAPLARLVLVRGSWSDGELRTGFPLTGVWRVDGLSFTSWLEPSLRQWHAGEVPGWSLPLTTTDDERLAAETLQSPATGASCRVLVQATDHERRDWLQKSFLASGWQVETTAEQGSAFAAAVVDLDALTPSAQETVSQLVLAIQPAPVFLLLSFPRLEDQETAERLGCRAIIAKPLVWSTLMGHFHRQQDPLKAHSDAI